MVQLGFPFACILDVFEEPAWALSVERLGW